MKLKVNPPTSKLFGVINWKELGKQLWAAVKPVLLAAIGGGIVSVAAGCSSLTPTSKSNGFQKHAYYAPMIRGFRTNAAFLGEISTHGDKGVARMGGGGKFGAENATVYFDL